MTDEVRKIAEGLSEAQRIRLRSSNPLRRPYFSSLALEMLSDDGFVYLFRRRPESRPSSAAFTPLGLAVRRYLEGRG